MSENPFRRVRKGMGLTIAEFATAIGIGSATVILLEKGAIKNPKIPFQKVSQWVYDPEKFKEEYFYWIREQRETLLKKLKP